MVIRVHSDEDKLLRSVALQNARAVLLARERAERELIAAKEELERKSAALARQGELLRVTLASICDGVITTDAEGSVTFLNPAAEAMTGWKSGEAMGQPLHSVMHLLQEHDRQETESQAARVLRGGVVAGSGNQAVLIARDGREIPIDDRAAPIRTEGGALSGAVMVFRDVREQRRAAALLRESHQSLTEARDHLEKRVQERTAELNSANENLRDLSGRLLKLQDDERRRLARELHDSVGQLLAAISMNISIVSAQSDKLDSFGARAVAENAHLVGQVSREIRTISHLLYPPLLEIAGLASTLDWYVTGFSERSAIAVDLECPPDLDRLPDDVELAIFRIVQECLTNIHRHSGSAKAAIRIQQEGNRVLLQVQDFGKGIPKERLKELKGAGTGVGFRGMRERLRQVGGTLEVQSEDNGTVINAVIEMGSPRSPEHPGHSASATPNH
jgi:PAS domain S-box-containing protein